MKERILEKAADLFMRYGIRAITMDEIAVQLGISKKTIYQFYTDKDKIVEAVVDKLISGNEERCVSFTADAENAVHEIFMAVANTSEMLRGMNPMIMYDLEKHYPKSHKRIRDFKYRFLYEAVLKNLERGRKEALFRDDMNIGIVAKHRVETAFMGFNQDIFPHAKFRVNDVLFELAYLYLYGITNAKGRKLVEKYMQKNVQKSKHGLYE
ncbi:MAG: TetR/AcrR family transcriptional regulator [Bacteroidetes bacterium]|nr:TetR/AcrR family transcriptional regulator [Bacteroidota bacterium]MBS1975254.1 TetR/AcrR family transcriptional regulator [Bacteroidota bacterium]